MTLFIDRDYSTAVYDFVIPARKPWSGTLKQGQVLRIVDLESQQAVDTILYNAHNTTERYSAQDTLTAQGAAYIEAGTALMSNEGNVMATLVADTCGRHDTSAGA